MGEERVGGESGGLDALLRSLLGRVSAPPGLRQRILAALDREERRSSRGAARRWRFPLVRHPALLTALAASILMVLVVPPITLRLYAPRSPAAGDVQMVHLEGRVVCYDCALHGIPIEAQIACRAHGHASGIQTADGQIWRFALNRSDAGALLDPGLRGRRIAVEGRLYRAIGYLDVTDYSPL
ncbi:MAG: anti-sigma factor [Acidobacteriota bacterium]